MTISDHPSVLTLLHLPHSIKAELGHGEKNPLMLLGRKGEITPEMETRKIHF
jgi:hypothetical protein